MKPGLFSPELGSYYLSEGVRYPNLETPAPTNPRPQEPSTVQRAPLRQSARPLLMQLFYSWGPFGPFANSVTKKKRTATLDDKKAEKIEGTNNETTCNGDVTRPTMAWANMTFSCFIDTKTLRKERRKEEEARSYNHTTIYERLCVCCSLQLPPTLPTPWHCFIQLHPQAFPPKEEYSQCQPCWGVFIAPINTSCTTHTSSSTPPSSTQQSQWMGTGNPWCPCSLAVGGHCSCSRNKGDRLGSKLRGDCYQMRGDTVKSQFSGFVPYHGGCWVQYLWVLRNL